MIYSTSSPKTSPAPKLTVTAYAETSYSRYTSSDQTLKSKANEAGTGDKVIIRILTRLMSRGEYAQAEPLATVLTHIVGAVRREPAQCGI